MCNFALRNNQQGSFPNYRQNIENISNTMSNINEQLTKFAKDRESELLTDPDWIDRWTNYAQNIRKNACSYSEKRKKFNVTQSLTLYSKVSEASKAGCYDIRFKGQSVASINVNKKGKVVLSPKSTNKDYFDFPKGFSKVDWASKEAKSFRAFFAKLAENQNVKTKSPEHKVENALLREFSKKHGKDKQLRHIQPVCITKDAFFQMPTIFSASNPNDIKVAKPGKGGGIDILARVQHNHDNHDNHDNHNNGTRLCVFEVKDENCTKEPQEQVLRQAITYAVFIANLLREEKNDLGKQWYQIFGFQTERQTKDVVIPKELHIDVSTLMPAGNTGEYPTEEIIELDNNVKLHTFALYYDEAQFENEGTFSFSGSLKDSLM